MALLSASLPESRRGAAATGEAVNALRRPAPSLAVNGAASSNRRPSSRTARTSWRRRVSKRDILFVTMQLAIMSRAGIDMATALESVAKQSQDASLRNTLRQVHADVSGGVSVAEALSRHAHVFSDTYVAVVAAGEASGKLPEVLGQLGELQRGELRLGNSMRTLLGYPVLLATVCAVVLASLLLFVLPNFAQIFADSDVPLPFLTSILLALANELRTRFWLWLPLAGGAVAALVAALRTPAGRELKDRAFLRTRFLRDVTRAIVAGRTFRLLATMLDSGVPLLEALGLVKSSVNNRAVQKALSAVQNDVLSGRGMATSLMAADVMPPSAAEMIGMAERTGSLSSVSRLIGEFFEEEGESRLRALVGLLEPVIVVVMGIVVAIVVLSVMLPMFDLVTLAKQSG